MQPSPRRYVVIVTLLLVAAAGIGVFRSWQQRQMENLSGDIEPELERYSSALTNTPSPLPLDPSRPIRLAIGPLGLPSNENAACADLLTAQLSANSRIELVERRELERVLGELHLNLAGATRAADAVRAGKLLRADWFLLASTIQTGSHAAVLVRLVDSRSSVLRDAAILPADAGTAKLATELSGVVERSITAGTHSAPATYLGIGEFRDLSLNNRYATLPGELRSFLTASYQGSPVKLVEREHMNALLREVQLDLAGLTDQTDNSAPPTPMQSAYWLVDGFYQSYEQSGPEVDLVLRAERVLGGMELTPLRGQPAAPFFQKTRQALDAAIARGAQWKRGMGRRNEVQAQLRRALETGGLRDLNLRLGMLHGPYWAAERYVDKSDRDRARRDLDQAIRLLETTLLLEPGNEEAALYLAACLRHPVVGRLDEARNYYRQVMATSPKETWIHSARLALADSYLVPEPGRAAELYRMFLAQAPTNRAADFRRGLRTSLHLGAEPTAAEGPAQGEQSLRQTLQKLHAGLQAGQHMGAFYFSDLRQPGEDRAQFAQRISALLPALQADFPLLKFHLLCQALQCQVDTNADVVRMFRDSLDEAARDPESVPDRDAYFESLTSAPPGWAIMLKDYDLVVRLARTRQLAVDRGWIRAAPDVALVRLAFAHEALKQHREALTIFERLGSHIVPMGGSGPWGQYPCAFAAPVGAQRCREALGLSAPAVETHTVLKAPDLTAPFPLAVGLDEPAIWIAGGAKLVRFDPATSASTTHALPMTVTVTAVRADSRHVWVGTRGHGLFEFDKSTSQFRHCRVQEGLLQDSIACLHVTDDSLWIGYGTAQGGGLGRLELASGRFANYTPALAVEALNSTDPGTQDPADAPPRHRVAAIASTSAQELWLAVSQKGIQRFDLAANRWETFRSASANEAVTSVAASTLLVAVGSVASSWNSSESHRLGGLDLFWPGQPGSNLYTVEHGLPIDHVTAVAMQNQRLWIGGLGGAAVLDPRQRQVIHTYSLDGPEITQIIIGAGNAWLASERSLYRVLNQNP